MRSTGEVNEGEGATEPATPVDGAGDSGGMMAGAAIPGVHGSEGSLLDGADMLFYWCGFCSRQQIFVCLRPDMKPQFD